MLAALVGGDWRSRRGANLARGRLRQKLPALREALARPFPSTQFFGRHRRAN